jgi:hypothetical protein
LVPTILISLQPLEPSIAAIQSVSYLISASLATRSMDSGPESLDAFPTILGNSFSHPSILEEVDRREYALV